MKTLADLEAKIAEHFKQKQAPEEIMPRTWAYQIRRVPDAEEQLIKKMWDDLFAPKVGRNVTIFWRRRLGFQRTIPDGMSLSCRAEFIENAP